MRRAFWILLGVGAGAVIGVSVVRAVNRTKRRMNPATIARNAGERSGAFAERVRDALDAGRDEMLRREAELRAELKLD
jgi:hypothetical protein